MSNNNVIRLSATNRNMLPPIVQIGSKPVILLSFLINMLWSMVSKAFEKSRKTPQENRPSSIALWILAVIRRVACIVECFSLKPNWLTYKMLYLSIKLTSLLNAQFLLKIESKEMGP